MSSGNGGGGVIKHDKYVGWRPTGRHVTTLYEHKAPVVSISTTNDS